MDLDGVTHILVLAIHIMDGGIQVMDMDGVTQATDGAIQVMDGDIQDMDGAILVMAILDTVTPLLTLIIAAEEDLPMQGHTIMAAIAETTILEIIPIAETATIVEITASTETVPTVETVLA